MGGFYSTAPTNGVEYTDSQTNVRYVTLNNLMVRIQFWNLKYTDCISAEEQDSPNVCPRYDSKQSDSEGSIMLELWGMRSTSSLPSLLGPLWPRVAASDWVLFMDQIELKFVYFCQTELFKIELFLTFKLRSYARLDCLKNCFYI